MKIPSTCVLCGEALSRSDMDAFLEFCERRGCDPLELAFRNQKRPGVACQSCWVRRFVEEHEDGNRAVVKAVRLTRFDMLGMRLLDGGKDEKKGEGDGK